MLISCKNLSKHYQEKRALDDISLTLEAGAPIALVGPNGAGKTTLFSLLCGYILPTKGDIEILGEKPGSNNLQGKVSALPQDAALDPNFSVLSQLSFFAQLQGFNAKQAKLESMRVLQLVDLEEAAKSLPGSLSHGMSKRVAIAQALIGKPELVLLDEPTAGLDPANARKVRQIVKDLSGETTFVISSHNLEELEKLCDQVLYLEQGKLQQSVSMHAEKATEFLTLSLVDGSVETLIEPLQALSQVITTKPINNEQIVIEYHKTTPFALETQLLDMLKTNQMQYKTILHGRTLEDTLFSATTSD